jgi:hypothetical protein
MKKPRLLLCMLALASVAIFTACDDDDEGEIGGDGGGGTPNQNLAPTTLSGRTMNVVVFDGTAPFDTNGTYNISFDTETTHRILDETGGVVTQGTYSYTRGTDDDARIVFQGDNRGTVTSDLFFDTANSGTIDSFDNATGTESGDFTLQ